MPKKEKKKGARKVKKDKVIHTRVPEQVEEKLKERAAELRIPVAALIRNILEDAFQLVENVVSDSLSVAQVVRKDALRIAATAKKGAQELSATKLPEKKLELQWKRVRLNEVVDCSFCGTSLPRRAWVWGGRSSRGETLLFCCRSCFKTHNFSMADKRVK